MSDLNAFFDCAKRELVVIDLINILKAVDLSGNWERLLLLFEWVVYNLCLENVKLNNQIIEIMVILFEGLGH